MDILDALDAYEDFEEETNVRPYEDDVDWESMLPPDWESIVRRAYRGPLEYDSFEDLYNQLCNHVLLGDGREVSSFKLQEIFRFFVASMSNVAIISDHDHRARSMGQPDLYFYELVYLCSYLGFPFRQGPTLQH